MYATICFLWQQHWLLVFSRSMQIKVNYVKKPVNVIRYIPEISDRGILNTLRPLLLSKWMGYREESLYFQVRRKLDPVYCKQKAGKCHSILTTPPKQNCPSLTRFENKKSYSDEHSKIINPNSVVVIWFSFLNL